MDERAENESIEQVKKIANIFWIFLKQALKPYLPVILIGIGIFFLLVMLIAGVYSAFPSTKSLTGIDPSSEDRKVEEAYKALCNDYNVIDTWVINETPLSPESGNAYESSPGKTFYPGKGVMKLGRLGDRFGQDGRLALRWGQAHAATLYETYNLNISKIDKELQEKVVKGMHPYFYYKMSNVIIVVSGKGGSYTEITPVPLLVEAYTIQGHYQYHYKWNTRTISSGETTITITEEILTDCRQIMPNRWQRLEDWMVDEYKIKRDGKDLAVARTAVWEAGVAYDSQKEWLDWLQRSGLESAYLTQSSIPPELITFFKEAESKFGIPWWFSAAVAYKESSFRTDADNRKDFPNASVHCYGIMQLSDENWESYSRRLGFDPVMDRDNPRAQILCGVCMLKNLMGDISWGEGWQERTLPALTFYGGYRGNDAAERCRKEYAQKIWDVAIKFFYNAAIWPVPGCYSITSLFGDTEDRDHKHQGIDIACPEGSNVVSIAAGIVVHSGWENPSDHGQGFGKYVAVKDNRHLYIYGHLSQIAVMAGQPVNIGDSLGLSGSTGHSSGPHLHFQINDLTGGGDWGVPIDPLTVISPGV